MLTSTNPRLNAVLLMFSWTAQTVHCTISLSTGLTEPLALIYWHTQALDHLVTALTTQLPLLQCLVDGVAMMDVMAAFAAVSTSGTEEYVRPQLHQEGPLAIVQVGLQSWNYLMSSMNHGDMCCAEYV